MALSLIATAGFFFASQANDFIVQSGNNIREPFDPRRRPLASRQEHFHGILMSKQTLGECAVETLHNSLILVNLSAPDTNVCFVVFHLFGHAFHELAARVNLQHLWPSQRAAPVNCLRSLGNFGRIF